MNSAQQHGTSAHSDSLMVAHKGAAARKTERTDRVGNSAQRDQYLRDLDALDAVGGGDGGCFFDALGEVIARRMGPSNP